MYFTDWETEGESVDDNEGSEEKDEGKKGENSQESSQQASLDYGSESSSGGEDSQQCPICLARLRTQDVGTPDTCDHTFCLDCLLEWSKVRYRTKHHLSI